MIKSTSTYKIIPVVLSMFVVLGISLSTFHYHADAHADYVETKHQLSNDHYHCLICGSVFKAEANSDNSFFVIIEQETFIPFEPSAIHLPVLVDGYDGRAPPFFG